MSEYIKREDAIKSIKPMVGIWADDGRFYVDYQRVLDIINNELSADVVEVRHGYWRNVGKAACQCSECDYLHLGNNAVQTTRLYKYCPNCGAYMRMTKEQYESHVGDIYEDGEEE